MLSPRFPRLLVSAALLVVAWTAPTRANDPSQGTSLADAVERIAQDAIDSGNAVGVSVAVARGDEILLANGYGYANLETKTPATEDTVYRIGSITKQFTAAAILQLAEQGKLSLDDPVTKHLSNFSTGEREVTLRHLLQHTSGMQSFTSLLSYRLLMRRDVAHDTMLTRFQDLPYHFEPGERFRYCNSGYYLLGMVVESASELTYEQYVGSKLFKPLGMEHSYYDRAAVVIPARASGYRQRLGGFENAPYLSMTQPYSAGALASTVTDLIRWQRGLVNHKVLSAESYEQMTTPGDLSDGKATEYGLGLFIRKKQGRRSIGHGGGINGFRSDIIYFPDSDHTIVVLANCETANPNQISNRIVNVLFAKQQDKK